MTRENERRRRATGRNHFKPFLMLLREMLDSPQWTGLGVYARALVVDLGAQYNGRNNGDLCAAFSVMKQKGWHSSGTLQAAITEAIEKGFITKTRQGGRHKPSLYALTW